MIKSHHWMTTLSIAATLLSGCYATTEEDPASIADALEEENGGLSMTDEPPSFSDARLDEGEVDEEVVDPMDEATEVALMRERPDAVAVHALIQWGQLRGNPDAETPRNWTGAFRVSRGAILARRTVRFERPIDRLLPRANPAVLPFSSVTLPHRDGLVVTILDPEPAASEPLVLEYVNDLPGDAGPEGDRVAVSVDALLDGPTPLLEDELGNRMVAAATAQPIDACERGFLTGRWHRVADGRGVILGQVRGPLGGLRGHVRGIYGVRVSGERVFFAKYINREGEFRGLLRGTYGDGHFDGRWIDRSGERGVLGGAYRETRPGPEVGGHFVGVWRELTCGR